MSQKFYKTQGAYHSGKLGLVNDKENKRFIISVMDEHELKSSSTEITKQEFLEEFNALQLIIQKELNTIIK